MFINDVMHSSFKSRKLVPLKEYKGTILKLTPKDKEKISKLLEQRTYLEFELISISKLLEKKKTIIESSGLFNRLMKIEAEIRQIEDMIKDIKINRQKKQELRVRKKEGLMV